jgi:uncharacterized membrane protein YhaH (DUF805 family)
MTPSSMSFSAAIAACFSNYATFGGRARRAEYWWFFLFNCLASIASTVADLALEGRHWDGTGVVSTLVGLVLGVPGLAVSWRRLHDTGRSGWWVGGALIVAPILIIAAGLVAAATTSLFCFGLVGIGGVAYAVTMMVFYCLEGTPGPNAYGPDPKGRRSSTD